MGRGSLRRRAAGAALTGAMLAAALLALARPPAASAAAGATRCTSATDIEAIVDDSYSMQWSDPDGLRVRGLDLLIETLPATSTLGAIEFGSASTFFGTPAADPVFVPQALGPNAAAMQAALGAAIRADNGATDYNGAFALADAENPAAQARIFLTDGAHDEGAYDDAHLAHDVPTYVVGFGAGLRGIEDQQRLERIAVETRGRYYRLADASQLQAVINSIGGELTCRTPTRSFSDRLGRGQEASHSIAVAAGTRAVRIALTWASPRDRFKLTGMQLTVRGKPRQVEVERRGSATFSVVAVSGLRKGTLRFAVRAARIGSGGRPTLTTQVSPEAQAP